MSSTSSLQKKSKLEIPKKSNDSNNASTSQQKINSPKKIKLSMPIDNSLNSDEDDDDEEGEESDEVEEDECVIVEEKSQQKQQQQRHRITNNKTTESHSQNDRYAEQNASLAREVTKYRELAQFKEMRIQELDTENFKLREYVVTVEEFAYSQREYFERAEKRVCELEAILSSRGETNNTNNESHNQTNEETLNESEERIFDINNPISVELLKCLEKKMAPLKKFANRVESALSRITNGTQNEEEQESLSTTTPSRISTTSKTSLKRRQSSLTVGKSHRRSSLLSSSENSSTMLSEDELTLVTKPISPNTMRLFASNSIKSNETTNSTTPTSSLVVNQGQVNGQEIEENLKLADQQNLITCMGTFENAPLGLGTLLEEAEEMEETDEDPKMDTTEKKESTSVIKPLENYDEEEEEVSQSSDEDNLEDNLDENIIIEEADEQIELIDETQELTSSSLEKKSENVSIKICFFQEAF